MYLILTCILTNWQTLLTSRVFSVKTRLMQFPVSVTCRTQKVRVELSTSTSCNITKYLQVNTVVELVVGLGEVGQYYFQGFIM